MSLAPALIPPAGLVLSLANGATIRSDELPDETYSSMAVAPAGNLVALSSLEGHQLEVLSLPLYPELGEERAAYVVSRVRAFFASRA